MMALTNLASRSPTVAFRVANIPHILSKSDVEDLPTRLAASGALAMLTSTQAACEAIFDLQKERHRAFLVLAQLIDPSIHAGDDDAMDEESIGGVGDPGLVHRAATRSKMR
ncbi:hypothetical protein L210DRAFT_3528112 [Boletus edulis BED1]|uniref:Uncharacterized protein n=1 Tax=Boletus edulis BED1 TaxID=1328754 RepID=A0AAD4C0W0_BOLED|nr:hypothetical protein L210DRAFT_3528112 [Boletus edulis BED1]